MNTAVRERDDEGARLAGEVRARFGMLPNFFRPAPGTEAQLAGLWAFTQAAYMDSPLPSVFKERMFVHLLTNLAGNAAKYTSSGQITLRAAAAGNGVTVEIRDTGRGLGLPAAEAVERFSRGGARTVDGFGLGLSITHQAARALNATLRLQDNADGGTLATLTLPHTPPVSARILVIDDEHAIRDAIAYTLQAAGYQVTEAATGHDGLASTRREQPFDLIIVDLLLPDVPGTDLIRQLRSGQDGPVHGPRILAITAHTRVGTRDLALSAGADQFLTKPFTMNQLLEQAGALTTERAS